MIMITVILIIKVTIIKTKWMNKKNNNPTANVCGNKNNNEKITKNNDTISNNNSNLSDIINMM